MDFRYLEHPHVTSMVRTGHPCGQHSASKREKCAKCDRPVEPGNEKYNVLLEYNGNMLCVDCFEDAVTDDLYHDPVEFAKSLLLHVEKYEE